MADHTNDDVNTDRAANDTAPTPGAAAPNINPRGRVGFGVECPYCTQRLRSQRSMLALAVQFTAHLLTRHTFLGRVYHRVRSWMRDHERPLYRPVNTSTLVSRSGDMDREAAERSIGVATDGGDGTHEQLRNEILHYPDRFAVVLTILGHDEQMPTAVELEFYHKHKGSDTLAGLLTDMEHAGIIETVAADYRTIGNFPNEFYTLTTAAEAALAERNVTDLGSTLQQLHGAVTKPERVRRAERAPRPTRDRDRDR